jgi:hypothetical protein
MWMARVRCRCSQGHIPSRATVVGLAAQRPFEAYDQTTRKIFRFLAFSSPLLRSRRAPLQVSNRTVGDSMSPAFRSANQEAIGVKLNAMFLPTGCILPDGMGLIQTRFGENGMSVENATAATLDMGSECGVELHVPADRAFTCWHRSRPHRLPPRRWLSPLSRPRGRFNAADLGVVNVTRYRGFHVARATLHTRQIQQHASLGLVDEMVLRQIRAQ